MRKPLYLTFEGKVIPKARMNTQGKASPKSRGYLESQKAQAWVYKEQAAQQRWHASAEDLLEISALFFFSDNRIRDIDNLIGAVQDAIQYAGLIKNDRQIRVIRLCGLVLNADRDLAKIKLSVLPTNWVSEIEKELMWLKDDT